MRPCTILVVLIALGAVGFMIYVVLDEARRRRRQREADAERLRDDEQQRRAETYARLEEERRRRVDEEARVRDEERAERVRLRLVRWAEVLEQAEARLAATVSEAPAYLVVQNRKDDQFYVGAPTYDLRAPCFASLPSRSEVLSSLDTQSYLHRRHGQSPPVWMMQNAPEPVDITVVESMAPFTQRSFPTREAGEAWLKVYIDPANYTFGYDAQVAPAPLPSVHRPAQLSGISS